MQGAGISAHNLSWYLERKAAVLEAAYVGISAHNLIWYLERKAMVLEAGSI